METEPHAAAVSSRRRHAHRHYCQIASYLRLQAKYFDCTEVTEVKFKYLLGEKKNATLSQFSLFMSCHH